jgi:hypothetical protein
MVVPNVPRLFRAATGASGMPTFSSSSEDRTNGLFWRSQSFLSPATPEVDALADKHRDFLGGKIPSIRASLAPCWQAPPKIPTRKSLMSLAAARVERNAIPTT